MFRNQTIMEQKAYLKNYKQQELPANYEMCLCDGNMKLTKLTSQLDNLKCFTNLQTFNQIDYLDLLFFL